MTQQTRADLHAAIEVRYPDNVTEDITPLLLREGLHELVDSVFVTATDTGAVPNVPLYKVGTTYAVGFVVRYTPVGGQEGFYAALNAGYLLAPGPGNLVEWKVVPGPVTPTALSQEITLSQAQGIDQDQVVAGRTYVIYCGPDAQGNSQYLSLIGVSNNSFATSGTLEINGRRWSVRNVKIQAGTWEVEPDLATYVATENVGGVRRGDSFTTSDSAVVQMLVTYQLPAFISFLVDGAGSRTILAGTSFGAGFKSVTWATSNSTNVQAGSLTLQDVTAGTTLASNEDNDGILSASTAAFTAGVGESRRYRLTGSNNKGGTFSADLIIAGETQSYLGLSTSASLTGPQLVALGNAQLQGSRARTAAGVSASGGQYLYYAYDARHGDLTSIVMDSVVQVLGAFQKLGDVASINVAGAAVTLRVYRTNATNAFTNNTLDFK